MEPIDKLHRSRLTASRKGRQKRYDAAKRREPDVVRRYEAQIARAVSNAHRPV